MKTLAAFLVLLMTLSVMLFGCGDPPGDAAVAPTQPTNVTVTSLPGAIDVAWEHDGLNVTGFVVYRGANDALAGGAVAQLGVAGAVARHDLESVAEVGASVRSYRDEDVEEDTVYSYAVAAKGSGGVSAPTSQTGAPVVPEPVDQADPDVVFGLSYDAGGKFDGGFNEASFRGMERAVADLATERGLVAALLEVQSVPGGEEQGLRDLVQDGAELIVAHGFGVEAAVTTVAAEFPEVSFALIAGAAEGPNVRSVAFKEHEGAFLVGYIAGTLSQTGIVGFVGGMDIPLTRAYALGFEEGVAYACDDCTAIAEYVGDTPAAWNDPERAKELADELRAEGVDIIFVVAAGSGFGVVDYVTETMCFEGATRETPLTTALASVATYPAYDAACAEGAQPLFFIGADTNQNALGDTDDDPTTLNHGLTSMLKRVDVAAYGAAFDVVDDLFEGGPVVLGAGDFGVDYALDDYNDALLPEAVRADVEDVRALIASGTLVVTDYRTDP